jgi:hypothetical protein
MSIHLYEEQIIRRFSFCCFAKCATKPLYQKKRDCHYVVNVMSHVPAVCGCTVYPCTGAHYIYMHVSY